MIKSLINRLRSRPPVGDPPDIAAMQAKMQRLEADVRALELYFSKSTSYFHGATNC